jgi:replicative DNA helicase
MSRSSYLPDITLEHGLPASIDAERSILGAVLLEDHAYDEAAETLVAGDFALDSHQRIFWRTGEMRSAGLAVDIVTLSEELDRAGQLDSIGGRAYLASLTEGLPRRLSIKEYVRIVKDKSLLRQLINICSLSITRAADQSEEALDILNAAESGMLELRSESPGQRQTIAEAIVPLLNRLHQERTRTGDLLGLPTGIPSLDVATRGLQPGELTQVGARSGVGKSAAMVQAAAENCRQGTPVLVFSLEMTREQILRRIFSAVSGVPFPRIRDPKWASEVDMQAIQYAADKVSDWPLHIVDASGIRIEKLVAQARLAIRRDGVKLVCVDYAQIVSADGRDERLRVAAVSRGLTRLAKDEGVAVLVLSQLARADRANANRRPTMSDLRESSQLENDAHAIVLLHRPWDEDEGRLSSNAELIIAKQRSGETGIFPLILDRRTLTFHDAQLRQQQIPGEEHRCRA